MIITNYIDLICKFPALDIPQNLSDVYIPKNKGITVFKNYLAVDMFMSDEIIAHHMLEMANAVRSGIYPMCPWGNKGFKSSYIKVYEDYQHHPIYGEYVAWVVHI